MYVQTVAQRWANMFGFSKLVRNLHSHLNRIAAAPKIQSQECSVTFYRFVISQLMHFCRWTRE